MDHIVEVGCSGKLSLHKLVKNAKRVQIIEPIPDHIDKIKNNYKDMSHVVIHEVAIWNTSSKIKMYQLGETSYAEGIISPIISNHGYEPQSYDELWVEAKTFDEFDDGTIDVIDIDTEGAEWFVLQKMISQPKVIILETSWNNYINPYMKEIDNWMCEHNYVTVAQEGANTFYKRLGGL